MPVLPLLPTGGFKSFFTFSSGSEKKRLFLTLKPVRIRKADNVRKKLSF